MKTLIQAASLAAVVASAALAPAVPVDAADARVPVIQVGASDATSRFVALGIGKSVVIELPEDIKDVLVADPKIANAVIRTSRRAYMIGVAVGQTNIFFFDGAGKQIAGFDIAVTRDLNGVRAALKQTLPDADIRIDGVGDGVMLSGSVASAAESQQAYDLASRLVGDATKVVNGITVRQRDQVMLKVTVAEVRRDIIKQLGINLSASLGYASAVLTTNNPFTATGQVPPNSLAAGYGNAVDRKFHRRDPECDGPGGRHPHAGRAEPDRDLGRNRDLRRRRRIPDPQRPVVRHHQIAAGLPSAGRLQEVRRQPGVHADRAVGRPHQPQGDDRGLRPVDAELADPVGARLHLAAHHSVDLDPARRDHRRNSLRRLAGACRHDPAADQAGRSTASPA